MLHLAFPQARSFVDVVENELAEVFVESQHIVFFQPPARSIVIDDQDVAVGVKVGRLCVKELGQQVAYLLTWQN
jgi:hypothetical protein